MKKMISAFAFALIATGAACSKSPKQVADTTLNTDLSLAAQQRGYQPLDSLSPAERARANSLTGTPAPVGTAPRTTTARTTTTHRTSNGTVARRSTGGSSSNGSVSNGSGAVYQPAPAPQTVKHTQRDAAIGAAAGAIIGATTSRNKVKGGVIGAAVGGILGGVIGNNVDKTKKP